MAKHKIHCLVVFGGPDDGVGVRGLLSDLDLAAATAGADLAGSTAGAVATSEAVTVAPSETGRGSTRVYAPAVRSLRPPLRRSGFLGAMRLRAMRSDWRRHLITTRNEGVRGSSPRVGSPSDAAFFGLGRKRVAEDPQPVPAHDRVEPPAVVASLLERRDKHWIVLRPSEAVECEV